MGVELKSKFCKLFHSPRHLLLSSDEIGFSSISSQAPLTLLKLCFFLARDQLNVLILCVTSAVMIYEKRLMTDAEAAKRTQAYCKTSGLNCRNEG